MTNANPMFAAKIVDAVLSTIHQFASACPNMKVLHQPYHVYHRKTRVQFQLVDRIHNARVCRMELLSVHACQALSKVQIQFEAVLNRKVHANHSHAVLALHVTLHEIQYAIVQNQPLVILSDNVVHQL